MWLTVELLLLKDHLWKENQTWPTTKMPFSSTWQKRATSSQLSQTDFNADYHNASAPLTSTELLHTEEAKIREEMKFSLTPSILSQGFLYPASSPNLS